MSTAGRQFKKWAAVGGNIVSITCNFFNKGTVMRNLVLVAACAVIVAVVPNIAQAECQWKVSADAEERAMKAFDEKNYDKAIAEASEAIKLSPTNSPVHTLRGRAYIEKGDFDKAIADFTKVINMNIGMVRGRLEILKGDDECAPEHFVKEYEGQTNVANYYKMTLAGFAIAMRSQAYLFRAREKAMKLDNRGSEKDQELSVLDIAFGEQIAEIVGKVKSKSEAEAERVWQEQERVKKEEAERVKKEAAERVKKEEAAKKEQAKKSITTFTDSRDKTVYKKVTIGNQTWMAENLNYAKKSVCYDKKKENCAKYGRLYGWKEAMKACPAGWHLPKDGEWNMLVEYVGGEETAGKILKSTSGWERNGNGTDDYGFSALPGGYGSSSSSFSFVGSNGYWWSASEDDASNAYNRYMNGSYSSVSRRSYSKSYLFSVRCVQD